VPAPNAYELPDGDDGPRYTIRQKPKDPKKFQTPAPGTYEVDDDLDYVGESSPRYTFGKKTGVEHPNMVPAPNAYELPDGDDGPRYTIRQKLKDPKAFATPAPGTYEVDDDLDYVGESSPRYTFGKKTGVERPNMVPAPNSYELPDAEAGPRYTIRRKLKDDIDERTKYPAPCEYNPEKADAALNKAPAYTLRDRTTLPVDRTKKPAPNAYNMDDTVVKKRDPSHAFGMKHSPYIGAFKPGLASGTPEHSVTMQTSAIKPTDKVMRGGEVVRVTPEGLTCRWVDRGLASPRTNGTTTRTSETRQNADGSTTTRETTKVHRTYEMSTQ